MQNITQIFAIATSILFCIYIVHILRKELIEYQYALMWLGAGLGMSFFSIFPGVLRIISGWLGIGIPLNLIYFLVIVMGLILSLQMIISISHMRKKIYNLVQEVSILKMTITELVNKAQDDQNSSN